VEGGARGVGCKKGGQGYEDVGRGVSLLRSGYVSYCSPFDLLCDSKMHTALQLGDEAQTVTAEVRTSHDVHVPVFTLDARPAESEAAQAWDNDTAALFEWVGMAALGAQR
jgi:hypothetical protein